MVHRFCDDRACALQGDYTLSLQSEDSVTLLAGLKALMEERDFTAHLFSNESLWGAWIPTDSLQKAEELAGRLEKIPERTRHWIRLLVEDEREHVILVDRTYLPEGGVDEPVPGW